MKKILVILMLSIGAHGWAKEYKIIVANPPGSSSDFVARAVADEYKRQTGNDLILDYAPGGDHVIAAAKFQSQKTLAVSLGSTTMHVFNHVNKSTLPYYDSDFDHVGWIGWTPHIWYVKSDSKISDLKFLSKLISDRPVSIGVDGQSTQVNLVSLQKQHPDGKNAEMIIYKGSPMVLMDVLGGHIEVGIASISEILVNAAKDGKIKIIGQTTKAQLVINGQNVPDAAQILGVHQFNGGFLLSISPLGTSESEQLKKDLLAVIRSTAVKEKLLKIFITVSGEDANHTDQILKNYRVTVKSLLQK